MDRLMRSRVLLAEAAALGVTIEDLIAESSGSPRKLSPVPTVAQYLETVSSTFSKGTAGTYWSYWRLAIDQLIRSAWMTASRSWRLPKSGLDATDPEPTVDQPARTASARCALFSLGPSVQGSSHEIRPLTWRSPAVCQIDVGLSKTTSCVKLSRRCAPPVRIPTSTCCS